MQPDLAWVGPADTKAGNWVHPATLRTAPWSLDWLGPDTMLDVEKPRLTENPEAWAGWVHLVNTPGVPFLGRVNDTRATLIARHPAIRERYAVAVPFYAGSPNHDDGWIENHYNREQSEAIRHLGFEVYGVLRAVRTGGHKWAGDPVPADVLGEHEAALRSFGFRVGIWEGVPAYFDAARAAIGGEAFEEPNQ